MLRRDYLSKCLEMDSAFLNRGLCNLDQTAHGQLIKEVGLFFFLMCLTVLES